MRRLGDDVYRWLLRAFPAHLRHARGDDMVDLFRHLRRSEAGRPVALLRLWIRACRDAVVEGIGARWAAARVSAGEPDRRDRGRTPQRAMHRAGQGRAGGMM